MSWAPGTEVVCVDDSRTPDGDVVFTLGAVYVVDEDGLGEGGKMCRVTAYPNRLSLFWRKRFRPVQRRKTDISVFTGMLEKRTRELT